jgi:hypothetical protein
MAHLQLNGSLLKLVSKYIYVYILYIYNIYILYIHINIIDIFDIYIYVPASSKTCHVSVFREKKNFFFGGGFG